MMCRKVIAWLEKWNVSCINRARIIHPWRRVALGGVGVHADVTTGRACYCAVCVLLLGVFGRHGDVIMGLEAAIVGIVF